MRQCSLQSFQTAEMEHKQALHKLYQPSLKINSHMQ